MRDKAVITPGGTAQVDLLLNDLDPDGDVLVVKRVSRPSIPGVKVSIVDKRLAVVRLRHGHRRPAGHRRLRRLRRPQAPRPDRW
ncbi:hypothetical protein G5V59_07855 [Nocardioides sp. W3-2-3]|nr:hypothetical protein [Nocardioides convexus]